MGLATADAPELDPAKVFMAIISDMKEERAKGDYTNYTHVLILPDRLLSSALPPRC
ncbi:hypothetical protein K443DRAFT_684775 [Laccaria amethystina LaAM-08-1]|uniref:Uncharacterized protein n=1 Tax=Laccaria amethystina LaAM-08-1 TaxID=1095629 RepID=A0A0C9WWD9_9AGAR|nr:hypothetical protein K443DRAFT_684775 [Laccaria amethystina LaAM-08-1]